MGISFATRMGTHASDPTCRIAALVEALHPDGAVDAVSRGGRAPADLVLAGAVSEISLRPDGVAWIRVPPGRRRTTRRALARAGLVVRGSWLAVPRSAPRVLVRLVPRIGNASAAAAVPGVFGRALAMGGVLFEEVVPGVALLAQRPESRPPLTWACERGADAAVAVSASWHDDSKKIVVHGTSTVVKSTRNGASGDPAAEAAVVRELAAGARAAGAAVPTVVYAGPAGRRVALVEGLLPGMRAATHLHRRPDRVPAIVGRIAEWLQRWHVETRVLRPLEELDLERHLLAPARAFAETFPAGPEYVRRLEEIGGQALGRPFPFAAAHNDLTTWNVLLDGDRIGVVDWEVAEREAFPLVDLDYLIVDAISIARRARRDRAFASCSADGADAGFARELRQTVEAVTGVEPATAELARHACWLGHASNEAARTAPDAPRPFFSILKALAAA
jgi:hypothetical protein